MLAKRDREQKSRRESGNGRGVDGFNVNEASEVFLIKRENALHPVHPHRGKPKPNGA